MLESILFGVPPLRILQSIPRPRHTLWAPCCFEVEGLLLNFSCPTSSNLSPHPTVVAGPGHHSHLYSTSRTVSCLHSTMITQGIYGWNIPFQVEWEVWVSLPRVLRCRLSKHDMPNCFKVSTILGAKFPIQGPSTKTLAWPRIDSVTPHNRLRSSVEIERILVDLLITTKKAQGTAIFYIT